MSPQLSATPIYENTLRRLFLLLLSAASCATTPPPLPLPPLPSAAQIRWHLTGMSLFLHFGPNTFTDSEWGSGHVSPSLFNPSALDARQWTRAAAANGFRRVVLTAKHHDGFCLWPSAFTNYSVRSSPWKGDVIADLAAAVKEEGMHLGLYLSPWDRHDSSFGNTVAYNEFYLAQMGELLTRYGEIEEVWLDGAKGKGERDMEYKFETWFEVIHQHQPGVVIFSDAGPDVRWVGDEAGVAGSTCWSLFNRSAVTIGGDNNEQYSRSGDMYGVDWVPPECDVSIRPGWFWHSSERPKSAINLLDIYYKSVGRNCQLILNVPPNSSGLISAEDLQVLEEFTALRQTIFTHNLAQDAIVTASSTRGGAENPEFSPSNVLRDFMFSYWAPDEWQGGWELFFDFGKSISFNVLQLQEPIQMGQRVSGFRVEFLNDNGVWELFAIGTTIGYMRLLQFYMVQTQFLRLVIDDSRADPLIFYVGVYLDPFSNFDDVTKVSTLSPLNDSLPIELPMHTYLGNESRGSI